MKRYIAEVSYDGEIVEYELVAENAVLGRGVIGAHLHPIPVGMKFRLRDTPGDADGAPRVIGKISEAS
jgi:hypothetical protein